MNDEQPTQEQEGSNSRLLHAFVRTFYLQIPFALLTMLIADGGIIARHALIAAISFWGGMLIFVVLRNGKWTRQDSYLLLLGYWPVFAIVSTVATSLGK